MNRLSLALAISLAAPALIAQCTLTAPGTQIAGTPLFDSWTPIQPLGFAFPFNGTTYTDVYVSDHGMLSLSNAGVPASPAGGSFTYTIVTSSLVAVGPVIAAYWSDQWAYGGIFIDNTSGDHCTLTWLNAQTYGPLLPAFTTQVTLFLDGRVVLSLDSNVTNNGSSFDLNAIIGMGAGMPNVLPAASDLSAGATTADPSIFELWTTSAPNTPNPNFDVSNSTLTFIPLSPGWVVIKDPIACATKSTYGTGCNGLGIDSNPPLLGQVWNLTTTGIDAISPISITFFGPALGGGLPLPAIGINSPGCSIYVSAIVGNLSAANVGGTSVLPVPVPLNSSLQGADLSAQSLCLTLANPAHLSTSNGVTGVLGY